MTFLAWWQGLINNTNVYRFGFDYQYVTNPIQIHPS